MSAALSTRTLNPPRTGAPVVGNFDHHSRRTVSERQLGARGSCVTDHVGERLLDDAVGRKVRPWPEGARFALSSTSRATPSARRWCSWPLVVAEVVSFGAFFTGQAELTPPATHASLATPGALRAVAGSGLVAGCSVSSRLAWAQRSYRRQPRGWGVPVGGRGGRPCSGQGHQGAKVIGRLRIFSEVRDRLNPYTAYSIGCALVWAFTLAVVAAAGNKEQLRRILPVFGGWWIGWTSATIARYAYPPPKSRA
jgi:hypothetical protein